MNFKLTLLIAAMCVVLTGCAEWQSGKIAIATHAEQASRAALSDALWFVCKATPVGTIKHKFNTQKKMNLYNGLCSNDEALAGNPIEVMPAQ